MGDVNSSKSPLKTAAGTAGPRAIEAFSVLGNETRLSILLALWEASEPFAEENVVSFSELRDRVGMRDSGQFNYHLDKLTGRFLRKTEAGYELRRAGHQLIRTVISGAGIEEPSLDPTEIDMDCDWCGAPTAVTYQDQRLYIVCTECEGVFTGDDHPQGATSGTAFDPAGFTDRTPEEMLRVAWTASLPDLRSAIEGVCAACSGPMESSLHICENHTSEGVCQECGRRFAVMARFHCPVCKNHRAATPRMIVIQHPAVIAFYYEHGIALQYEADDFESARRRGDLVKSHEQELVSESPIRIQVTIQHEGDELQLTLDEKLDVTEVTRSD